MTQDEIQFRRTCSPGVDAMVAATAKEFPRHSHDQFGLGIVVAGRHLSSSDNKQVEANPGEMILVNPGEMHDGRPLDDRGRSWRMLYFDSPVLESAYQDITQKAGMEFVLCAPVIADQRLAALFNRAFLSATANMPAALDASLLDLVAQLSVSLGRDRVIPDAPVGTLDRVHDLINDDLTADLTLEALSLAAGLSRFQLHRGFSKRFGLAPHAYILQQRVAEARRLIRAGISLAEVAASSGFCDQSHLNRVFAKQFGVSPGQYASPNI